MNQLKDLFAKKVDERQEMDLLRVEHNSFYLMYFLILIEMRMRRRNKISVTKQWPEEEKASHEVLCDLCV